MKKLCICILVWFVIAIFFYLGIWTDNDSSLSFRWYLTGAVAIGQFMLTALSYAALDDN